MRPLLVHSFLSFGFASAFFAACQSLPPTKPLSSAGASGSGQGGSSAGSPTTSGTAGDASGGTAGSATAGTGGSTGGSPGSGGSAGASVSGGTGGSTGGSAGKSQGGEAGQGEGGMGEGGGDPGFFGDSRCTPDLLFCEDFEAADLDDARWTVRTSGDAPAVETTRAARGTRSVHFATMDNGLSLIGTTEPFPVANNRYYGRLFVWFDSMPTAPEWAHWTIAASETDADESEIRVGGQYDNTINRFGVGTDHGPTGDWTNLDEDPGIRCRSAPGCAWNGSTTVRRT